MNSPCTTSSIHPFRTTRAVFGLSDTVKALCNSCSVSIEGTIKETTCTCHKDQVIDCNRGTSPKEGSHTSSQLKPIADGQHDWEADMRTTTSPKTQKQTCEQPTNEDLAPVQQQKQEEQSADPSPARKVSKDPTIVSVTDSRRNDHHREQTPFEPLTDVLDAMPDPSNTVRTRNCDGCGCIRIIENPLCCPYCGECWYCDETCRKEAWDDHHRDSCSLSTNSAAVQAMQDKDDVDRLLYRLLYTRLMPREQD